MTCVAGFDGGASQLQLAAAASAAASSSADNKKHNKRPNGGSRRGTAAVAPASSGNAAGAQNFHLEVRERETGELLQNQTASQPVFRIRYLLNEARRAKEFLINAPSEEEGT